MLSSKDPNQLASQIYKESNHNAINNMVNNKRNSDEIRNMNEY